MRDSATKVSNPLIAIIAVANDGDVHDMSAKTEDYINVLFAFNHVLKYCVAYQSFNSHFINAYDSDNDSDKKSNDNNNNDNKDDRKLNYRKDRMSHQEIESELYQLLWTKEEIEQFGNIISILNVLNSNKESIWHIKLYKLVSLIPIVTKYLFQAKLLTIVSKFQHIRYSFCVRVHVFCNDAWQFFEW